MHAVGAGMPCVKITLPHAGDPAKSGYFSASSVGQEMRPMAVLTISREIGSRGEELGRRVAEELGYHFADKEVVHAVFSQYGFTPFEKFYDSPVSFWDRFDTMRKLTLDNLNRGIYALARHGHIVIVGRGSFAALRGWDQVLHVRVQAPFGDRVRRFMETDNIADQAEAERLLEQAGSVRAAFVESTYHAAWDAASNFDLVINTGKIPQEAAVSVISEILQTMDDGNAGSEEAADMEEKDHYMTAAVAEVLKCRDRH
jgi:cytidylate kinase